MSFEEKFRKQINDFQRYGTYTYEYDQVGNVIFNSSSNDFSQVFLALPLPNFSYDPSKITGFYDAQFSEFSPSTEETTLSPEVEQIQMELDNANAQNEELIKQLNSMIAASEMDPSDASKEATKQVILELRIQLGQGRVKSDFSEEFPYTALLKPNNITSDSQTTVQPTLTSITKAKNRMT